jgi:hypothetical protein
MLFIAHSEIGHGATDHTTFAGSPWIRRRGGYRCDLPLLHCPSYGDLPAWLAASIVISGTVATSPLTYEIIRRIAVLRPLFGLKVWAFEPAVLPQPSVQPHNEVQPTEKC